MNETTRDQRMEKFSERATAWKTAKEMVDPIVEQHGLELYGTGPNVFAQTAIKMTPVDQHVQHVINVADWLLETEY